MDIFDFDQSDLLLCPAYREIVVVCVTLGVIFAQLLIPSCPGRSDMRDSGMPRLRSQVLAGALTSMAATILLSIVVNQAAAQKSPNPRLGNSLAKRLCSSCHIIAGEPRVDSMLVDAPSFASIANKPGQSIEVIAGHIVFPHAEMPRIKLSRDEIAALSAYIFSFRGNTP